MSEQSGNWWEFYGVRYAQGTVVGAMLVFLLFSQNETLKKILFVPDSAGEFALPHLILLAVYGLSYCYIASAPVLLMHAGRGLLFHSATNPTPHRGSLWRMLATVVPACLFAGWSWHANADVLESSAIFLFVMLVCFQCCILQAIFHGAWEPTIDYYEIVVEKRCAARNKEYVESYRHIREHGNSFMIVFFQFLLAYPIFALVSLERDPAQVIANLIILVIAWIFPASFIWMFGNKLENHLQRR